MAQRHLKPSKEASVSTLPLDSAGSPNNSSTLQGECLLSSVMPKNHTLLALERKDKRATIGDSTSGPQAFFNVPSKNAMSRLGLPQERRSPGHSNQRLPLDQQLEHILDSLIRAHLGA